MFDERFRPHLVAASDVLVASVVERRPTARGSGGGRGGGNVKWGASGDREECKVLLKIKPVNEEALTLLTTAELNRQLAGAGVPFHTVQLECRSKRRRTQIFSVDGPEDCAPAGHTALQAGATAEGGGAAAGAAGGGQAQLFVLFDIVGPKRVGRYGEEEEARAAPQQLVCVEGGRRKIVWEALEASDDGAARTTLREDGEGEVWVRANHQWNLGMRECETCRADSPLGRLHELLRHVQARRTCIQGIHVRSRVGDALRFDFGV